MPLSREVHCPICGYSLQGLGGGRCPECGHVPSPWELPGATAPLSFALHSVDFAGLVGVAITNGVLAATVVAIELGPGWRSWFTESLWRFPRGPESVFGVLAIVLAASAGGWFAAWEQSSWPWFRIQVALALWCYALTVFHAIGVLSLCV